MPDWSYRTLFRPALFALPAAWGRNLALGAIGTLARLPGGGSVIDFMGHMRPSSLLERHLLGRTFCGPIGFSAALDPSGYALPGLGRFGVGFVEIGPCVPPPATASSVRREDAASAIFVNDRYTHLAADRALASLAALPSHVAAIVRFAANEPGQCAAQELAPALAGRASSRIAAFAIEATPDQINNLARISAILPPHIPRLLVLPADAAPSAVLDLYAHARASGVELAGVLIDGAVAAENAQRAYGPLARESSLQLVAALRAVYSPAELCIVAGGGVHEPQHALDLFAAGADLVTVESGLVYSGPGLVKRINEALVAQAVLHTPAPPPPTESSARYAWFWMWLMSWAMFGGGLLALAIAGTRVVLPYDEHFVGMTRAELAAINPRLLAFLTHDRVTLAGTMLAIGILYGGLAWHGVRRGLHWAWAAVLRSALVGFFSFFTFLGYGYFEPFHAFVTVALFQLLLLAWHAPLGTPQHAPRVPLVEDWRWRLAQWGQLLLVVEALAVLTAGVVICIVGSTTVFVREDLEFMNTCSADLVAANPRLLALIAHDRATFGGMLVSCGLTTLMAALWGFAAGRAWLFSTLLCAGSVGYLCTIVVHYAVGYVDLHHLLPAYAGLAVHLVALSLAGPFLLWREFRQANNSE